MKCAERAQEEEKQDASVISGARSPLPVKPTYWPPAGWLSPRVSAFCDRAPGSSALMPLVSGAREKRWQRVIMDETRPSRGQPCRKHLGGADKRPPWALALALAVTAPADPGALLPPAGRVGELRRSRSLPESPRPSGHSVSGLPGLHVRPPGASSCVSGSRQTNARLKCGEITL